VTSRRLAAAALASVAVLSVAACSTTDDVAAPTDTVAFDGSGADPEAFCAAMRDVDEAWDVQAPTSLAADPDAFDVYVDEQLAAMVAAFDEAIAAAPALTGDLTAVRDEADGFFRDAAAWVRDSDGGAAPTFDLEAGAAQQRIDDVVEPSCGFTVWF
jgi:hypothetical protein